MGEMGMRGRSKPVVTTYWAQGAAHASSIRMALWAANSVVEQHGVHTHQDRLQHVTQGMIPCHEQPRG